MFFFKGNDGVEQAKEDGIEAIDLPDKPRYDDAAYASCLLPAGLVTLVLSVVLTRTLLQ